MQTGDPRESATGEPRVAAIPETASQFTAPGHAMPARSRAGAATHCIDAAGVACGTEITDRADGGTRARTT